MPPTEDQDKAEKLAAAKKRVELLKKQKAKKAPVKKKDESTGTKDGKIDAKAENSSTAKEDENKDEDVEAGQESAVHDTNISVESKKPAHGRAPSLSAQSKLRSDSFRKASSGQGPTSPTVKSPTMPPLSPSGDAVQDIYRKQAQRIEELEKENKNLQGESQEAQTKRQKMEEELEELREANSDLAGLKTKANQATAKDEELDKLKTELASLQRQNSQLMAAASKRRVSGTSPNSNEDLQSQLDSKSATIESLELEISKMNTQISAATKAKSEQADAITSLESKLEKSEQSGTSSSRELADLKANLDQASERAVAEGSSRTSAETRVAQLEAELGTAKRSADDAIRRADTLEKKIEAVTTLHREAESRTAAKLAEAQKHERDARELRARVTSLSNENSRIKEEMMRRKKMEVEGDDAGLDELEDEERTRLQTLVRELQEEVFELRRGVWRDKRKELQPGLDDQSGFDEVDLSGTPTSVRRSSHGQQPKGGSTFQDVINSGISAFTGTTRQTPRKQSLGLLEDDDMEFDEDAFKVAQEEQATKQVERMREVKRGLTQWKTWRLDIAELRAGMGGVFDV